MSSQAFINFDRLAWVAFKRFAVFYALDLCIAARIRFISYS